MPIREQAQFKSVPDKMFEIPQPAIGGLDLKDLEYEQGVSNSPYMKNIMYRNGAFGKRFGQEVHSEYADEIYAEVFFDDDIFVHSGTKIYKYNSAGTHTQVASGMPESGGVFIIFAQKLYYLNSSGFYLYNSTFSLVNAYVPELLINCKPDGTGGGDSIDELNIIGSQFSIVYNGESAVTVYKVGPYNSEDIIDWAVTPTINVNDEEWTYDATLATNKSFKFDAATQEITFNPAPGEGDMNVEMIFTMKNTVFATAKAEIFSCKYYDTFGGANNNRLFLAGCGKSKYFYSDSYDVTYFPENNFATIGNTEDDITGFGRQYNVLIVFKPREVYSIYSYTETASTTIIEENIGVENFRSQLVNSRIGCDAPYSIQLVNNYLTWFNSNWGVCTLVSTNIQDERNVRILSRNIEETNNFSIEGVLDIDETLSKIQSADYNNKYFLVFPTSGTCFMWDYELQPFVVTSRGETDPKLLVWFYFDKFYVKSFLHVGKQLLYACSHTNFKNKLIKLSSAFHDANFELDEDGEGNVLTSVPISSFYMTPFFQFNSVEMLKNVRYIYIQCRGDSDSVVNLSYLTDDSSVPEIDPEPINIDGGGKMWKKFNWSDFRWYINVWGNVFVRKCNLKKVQMAAVLLTNSELDKDMPVTNIGLRYQYVKYVR